MAILVAFLLTQLPAMHTSLQLAALAATFSSALAAFQGFNYGSAHTDQSPKFKSDFEMEFKAARNLAGAPPTPFTSARLYTTIVSDDTPAC